MSYDAIFVPTRGVLLRGENGIQSDPILWISLNNSHSHKYETWETYDTTCMVILGKVGVWYHRL